MPKDIQSSVGRTHFPDRCSCGHCRQCTTVILAALRTEARPPAKRTGIGALVKLGRR